MDLQSPGERHGRDVWMHVTTFTWEKTQSNQKAKQQLQTMRKLSTQAQLLFANKKTQTYVTQQKNKVVNKVLSTIISSRDENQSELKNLICFVFFFTCPIPNQEVLPYFLKVLPYFLINQNAKNHFNLKKLLEHSHSETRLQSSIMLFVNSKKSGWGPPGWTPLTVTNPRLLWPCS